MRKKKEEITPNKIILVYHMENVVLYVSKFMEV